LEENEKARVKELTQKIVDAEGDLSVLTRQENHEMMRLVRKWASVEEFGHPISGEDF